MMLKNSFLSNKRGAELSLNVIVVAAIVLIVLIVLVILFAGKIGKFRTTTDECTGTCAETIANCKASIGYKMESCGTVKPICCPSGLETS